jgi:hypothetical protein
MITRGSAHTFSQKFSQGTITKRTRVALSCLISLLWHLWGFDVYRSVALVDRSEYPTLVYEMDQWMLVNGLVGVAFIALNHPYSRWGASARKCIGGRSVTLQRSILTSPTDTPDISTARSMAICLSHTTRMVRPWSRTVRTSSIIPFSQLVTFGLNQVFTCGRSMNYSRTVRTV